MRLTASPNIFPNILSVGMHRTLLFYDLTAIFELFFSSLLSKSAILTSSLLYGYLSIILNLSLRRRITIMDFASNVG